MSERPNSPSYMIGLSSSFSRARRITPSRNLSYDSRTELSYRTAPRRMRAARPSAGGHRRDPAAVGSARQAVEDRRRPTRRFAGDPGAGLAGLCQLVESAADATDVWSHDDGVF